MNFFQSITGEETLAQITLPTNMNFEFHIGPKAVLATHNYVLVLSS